MNHTGPFTRAADIAERKAPLVSQAELSIHEAEQRTLAMMRRSSALYAQKHGVSK